MTKESKVRVRIAPSPTGPLHLGTARTALFNFLFAKKNNGVFILRIEDTDLQRSDPKFEQDIVEGLKWLGIDWDEGVEKNGAYGPYRQSKRTATYEKPIQRLLNDQKAYYCFCTEAELKAERETQRGNGEAPRYGGKCRNLSEKRVSERFKITDSAIVRLKMPEERVVFSDLIRGEISFDAALFGDIVIAKYDKKNYQALYNFAATIDDAEMDITHVLRGEDHIANTPKQILIARLLNLQSPQYGHFPLILAPDRSKLSKRHGAISISELREMGYFPETLVNFLALLGWNPGDDKEIFNLEELTRAFDLLRVQKSGAVWNQDKLEWLNRAFFANSELRWLTADKIPEGLFKRMKNILEKHGWEMSDENINLIAPIVLERTPLKELETAIVEEYSYFFEMPEPSLELLRWKDMQEKEISEALQKTYKLLSEMSSQDWTKGNLLPKLLAASEEWGSGDKGRILWPLRVALTWRKYSPPPFDIAVILGKEETLRRIEGAISAIK